MSFATMSWSVAGKFVESAERITEDARAFAGEARFGHAQNDGRAPLVPNSTNSIRLSPSVDTERTMPFIGTEGW